MPEVTSQTDAAAANSDRLRAFLKKPPAAAAVVEEETIDAAEPETEVEETEVMEAEAEAEVEESPAAAPEPVKPTPAPVAVAKPTAPAAVAKPTAALAKPTATPSALERMKAMSTGGSATAAKVEEEDEGVTIAAKEIDDFWEEGWHFVRIISAERKVSKGKGTKMYELSYRCLAGPMQGSYKTDYWPLEGKGVKKTARAAAAVGMRDAETGDVKIPNGQALVGKDLWIEIIHKIELYDKEDGSEPIKTTKDEIRFPDGYRAAGAFEVPKAGDLFAEGPIKAE